MDFRIKIETDAVNDIQTGIEWYNKQKSGLGRKFHSTIKATFKKLKINPFYQKRYNNVHCLPIKKYPYMIHFTIDEAKKIVSIRAVFHTSLDTKKWKR